MRIDTSIIATPNSLKQEANQFLSARDSIVQASLLKIANYRNQVATISSIKMIRDQVEKQLKPKVIVELEKMYATPSRANCYVFDQLVSELDEEIQKLSVKKLARKLEMYENDILLWMQSKRVSLKNELAKYNCKRFFEEEKLKESASLLGGQFTKTDDFVVSKSNKTQNYLLIGGAAVLLIGLFLILQKKK